MIEIRVEIRNAVAEVTALPEGVKLTIVDHDAPESGNPLIVTYERIGGHVVAEGVILR